MLLEEFNDLDRAAAIASAPSVHRRPALVRGDRRCATVRLPGRVAERRPKGLPDPFTAEEIEAALVHHPRIGERAGGGSKEATLSRAEQSGVDSSDSRVANALAAGNVAYEEKFGRVFLIAAAGRSADEILAALHARLENSADDEELIVAEQLRRIALLRLEGLVSMSQITTHVLDTNQGVPAVGIAVELSARDGGDWQVLAAGVTDADGRAKDLGPDVVALGEYRLRFDTGAYFAERRIDTFFPEVVVHFSVTEEGRHYHVPVLLSPFSYSTYRGT